jgi:murein DD-endopeptidase MepM/ murein hydrolase activator NlpD
VALGAKGEGPVAEDPRVRGAHRARVFVSARADRHGWMSHTLLALAISALGLAVAGSVSLTTSAETTNTVPGAVPSGPVGVGSVGPVRGGAGALSHPPPAPAQAFPQSGASTGTTRSPQLGAAIVAERAAQRAESLARISEEISLTVRDRASAARQKSLNATERVIAQKAVELAWARQQRALAARILASNERATIQSASTTTTPAAGTAVPSNPGIIPSGGAAVSPVPGAVIGAGFGDVGLWARYHTGLDFRAASGTPIHAVMAGVVLFAGNTGDWAGNHVAIKHADGMTTMYSHMSAIAAQTGQTLQAGQIIGYVGETGRAFGPHLHFELYPPGIKYGDIYAAINPQPWLVANGVQTH